METIEIGNHTVEYWENEVGNGVKILANTSDYSWREQIFKHAYDAYASGDTGGDRFEVGSHEYIIKYLHDSTYRVLQGAY